MAEKQTELSWQIKEKDGTGTVVYEGDICNVREALEKLVSQTIGIYPMLQEDEEEGVIYLHSEFGDELEPTDVALLHTYGFSEDWDETTLKAIEKLLVVNVKQY